MDAEQALAYHMIDEVVARTPAGTSGEKPYSAAN